MPKYEIDPLGIVKGSGQGVGVNEVLYWDGAQIDSSADLVFDPVLAILFLDANLIFKNPGKGLLFGSFYGNDIAFTAATATQNQWYLVSDADISDGVLNGITHNGSGKLTVATAGVYKIDYSLSIECSLLNKHVEFGIAVSGTPTAVGTGHLQVFSPNAEIMQGGTALLSLAANATVEIAIRTTDIGTPDILVDHISLTLVQVGG